MTIRWQGRDGKPREQVANACDDFPDLTPASDVPAATTKSNWSALLSGQTIPLIGEDSRYGYREDDEDRFC